MRLCHLALTLFALPLCSGCFAIPVGRSPADFLEEHQNDYWTLAHPPIEGLERNTLIVGFYPAQRYLDSLGGVDPDAKSESFWAATLINLGLFGAWIPVSLVGAAFFDYQGNSSAKQDWAEMTLLGYVKTSERTFQSNEEAKALLASPAAQEMFADFDPSRPLRHYAQRIAERANVNRQQAYFVAAFHYGRLAFHREVLAAVAQASALGTEAQDLSRPFLVVNPQSSDFASFPAAERKLDEAIAGLLAHERKQPQFYASGSHANLWGAAVVQRAELLERRVVNRALLTSSAARSDDPELQATARAAAPAAECKALVAYCEQSAGRMSGSDSLLDAVAGYRRELTEILARTHVLLAADCLARGALLEADEHRQRVLAMLPAEHPTVGQLQKMFAAQPR